jgi:DNA end-binding protein Ku
MAPRPIWKGQIRLSLVSIPVEMFSATQSGASISFRQIHRESGKRIHYDKVVEGIGPVDKEEIVKGYEVGKDDYVLLTDEEIEDVKIETKKTLELVQFVDTCSIPPLYFDKPYYVVPQDELAEDAFRVVRDALRQTKKTGLGQLSLRGKEYLVALRPCGTGLLLETLHYEDEIRKSDTIFSDISDAETDGDLLDVATQLIEKKTAPFDASNFKNHYTAALKALIAEKRKKGGKARVTVEDDEPAPADKGSNVVDLMATLKKSLEGGGGESGEKKSGAKSGASSARGSKAKTTAKSRSTKASGSKSTKSGSAAKATTSRRKSA